MVYSNIRAGERDKLTDHYDTPCANNLAKEGNLEILCSDDLFSSTEAQRRKMTFLSFEGNRQDNLASGLLSLSPGR